MGSTGSSPAPAAGSEILARLAVVDGLASGLDADLVRGCTPQGTAPQSHFGGIPRAGQVPRVLTVAPTLPPSL